MEVDQAGVNEQPHSGSQSADVTDHADEQRVVTVKTRRRHLRGRITRAMNRVREVMRNRSANQRRLQKEGADIRADYSAVCALHSELYDVTPEGEHSRLDKWESDLSNDLYAFEEEVEDYLAAGPDRAPNELRDQQPLGTDNPVLTRMQTRSSTTQAHPGDAFGPVELPALHSQQTAQTTTSLNTEINETLPNSSGNQSCLPFDCWIDNLVEFSETVINVPNSEREMSLADALYRLEASKDVPNVKLTVFDGNPLTYVEFIETFKIHVHDKTHLSDNMRMVQLRMHVSGEAERAISGLGSGGVMYATALKILKDQFGQKSVVARAFINRITKGSKLTANNRHGLRELSLDVINCLATLRRLSYFSDVNAIETLRSVVNRFPDYLIPKWKATVADIRERGNVPTLEHISLFLRKQIRALFDPDFGDLVGIGSSRSEQRVGGGRDRQRGVHSTQVRNVRRTLKCFVCDENHSVAECPTFLDSTVSQKVQLAKANRLCFSCLIKGHMSKDCRTKKRCDQNGCTRTHHPLLHTDPPSASSASPSLDRDGILPVVRARFRAANGRIREGNILIDSGAGTTIIRKDFAKSLGLQGKQEGLELSVVGGRTLDQKDSRRVKCWVSAIDGDEEYEIEAHEIDKTVVSVPALDRQWLASFSHLADLNFSHRAGPIDLILGVQHSHLHAELEIRQGSPFEPLGKCSRLGWFVIGAGNKSSPICSVNFVEKVDFRAFYDLETLGVRGPQCDCPQSFVSAEDKKAMDIFEITCHKEGDRYAIGLPWKTDASLLPNNYFLAERRLLSLERSLLKNPSKADLYKSAVAEYLANGWAVEVTQQEFDSEIHPVYYLPHHGVVREDKPSTPLRVVFDPACSFRGVSLNSFLHKGPCLIGNLLAVLLRFREDTVAFVGDIAKMFLQILLSEKDSHVHRFLWRGLDASKVPSIYRLTRVTFGDKPSPDMASFVMLKLAKSFEDRYPEAADVIRNDRYVDDLIHSCPSASEAAKRMQDLDKVLADGSFKVKEWFCSSGEALERVNCGQSTQISTPRVNSDSINLSNADDVKTLGVCWKPSTDTIHFHAKDFDLTEITKRAVLSKLSMLYDPLGLVSVVTIRARVAMQAIWRMSEVDWDDPLPPDMCQQWRHLFTELQKLKTVQFPRCLKPEGALGPPELHVFSDASGTAYGAVAYVRYDSVNGPSVRLAASKARVAPLRQATIPRLELMAALIASRLAKTIVDEFRSPLSVSLWSDSQIVLHWIRSDSLNLKAFVGVRVAEIQNTWDTAHWRFVPTNLNPADDLSRGLDVHEIAGRWTTGPGFLLKPKSEWPEQTTVDIPVDSERKGKPPIAVSIKLTCPIDCSRFSSWTRLVRVTAYCFRFLHNLRRRAEKKTLGLSGTLQVEEIEKAEAYWIHQAQNSMGDWPERYKDLSPFDDGFVRVGGRLRRSNLEYEQAHPILLPPSHNVSKLIMRGIHVNKGHPGCERTLCDTRRRFWVVKGRSLARDIVHKCTVCRKLRQEAHSTLMADLPSQRLKLFCPPFTTTGIDLFGPFNLRYGRNKTQKAWGALFTCATVRAIHLEIVGSLSVESFLLALRRFVASHGWPETLISDNGTSFTGAEKELKTLMQDGQKQIEDFAMLHKVKWIFITPLSPHQGGFYESLIKQTKRAVQVAIGQQILTWNEMSTVFAEVKCLVNSRPLGYSSNDPDDQRPLTPNHFILGRASPEVPQGPYKETKDLRKRFLFVQALVGRFWTRFVREYVQTLNQRSKWMTMKRQVKVGDIVLLVESNVPRGKWNLARVVETYPGCDNVVRNVKVKTKSGVYKRSVQKCCLILESEEVNP